MPALAGLLRRFTSALVLRCLLFVSIFSLAALPPLDPDLWWHLANGRLIASTASIPHVDLYSFSAAGQPWVMHEWLADLGMYGLYQLGGLPLLVAVSALLVTGAGKLTVREAQFPSGLWMTKKPTPCSRKATGNRDSMVGPSTGRPA